MRFLFILFYGLFNCISGYQELPIYVALKQYNINILQEKLVNISSPESSNYGHWMEIDEINKIVSPPMEHQEKVLAFFTDFKENGRFINVEITEDRGGRDRKRGGGRRRDGGNDRKRRSDKPKGERRSRRSEDFGGNKNNKKSKRSDRDKSEFKSTHGRPRRSRR